MPHQSDDDIRVRVGFVKHAKTVKLRRVLGADAVIALLVLWGYARMNHPRGTLTGLDDDDIEVAAEWGGERGALVKQLVAVGFIDGEKGARSLHDWKEHQRWAIQAPARQRVARNAARARWGSGSTGKKGNARSMHGASSEHAGSNAPLLSSPSPIPTPLVGRSNASRIPDSGPRSPDSGGTLSERLARERVASDAAKAAFEAEYEAWQVAGNVGTRGEFRKVRLDAAVAQVAPPPAPGAPTTSASAWHRPAPPQTCRPPRVPSMDGGGQ